jgi:hypothetical protein
MNNNHIVRVRMSVKLIRETLGLQDNGYANHAGLEAEDACRRKRFTGSGGQVCDGFYHFHSANTGRAKSVV